MGVVVDIKHKGADAPEPPSRASRQSYLAEVFDVETIRSDRPSSVLVVEDDDSDWKAIKKTLDAVCGRELMVHRVHSVKDGLAELNALYFDIAFVAFHLNDGDGIDLIRRAGGRLCRTPLILLTGEKGREIEDAALRAGAIDFVDKESLNPPVLDRVIRFARVHHAITKRLLISERRAREAMLEATSAANAKSRFLTLMSHELRTPLNAIMGFAEVIRDCLVGPVADPVPREAYAEYASQIHLSGRHLLGLINDLLDNAKIEAGQFTIDPQPVAVEQAVDDAMRSVASLAKQKQLTLRNEVNSEDLCLVADERRFKQILLNLLSNAIKFTPPGGEVRIEAEAQTDGTQVTVSDTGIGMKEEMVEQVFEPFGQIDNPYTRNYTGTGLGLFLVKRLVEVHGGRIEAESKPDQGFTVRLFFPNTVATPAEGVEAGAAPARVS